MQEAHCPRPSSSSGEEDGNGLAPTVAVLVVSLAVAAIGVYELCGFGLHSLNPRPHLFNNGFATAGVIVATVSAGAAFGNLAWLLTASRRRAAGLTDGNRTGAGNGNGNGNGNENVGPAQDVVGQSVEDTAAGVGCSGAARAGGE
jgi:hypothetical protein